MPHPSSLKIAATLMVRDEASIIADCIGHLLINLRVDRVYVANNNSTDDTLAILQRIAALDPRLSLLDAPDPYEPDVIEAALTAAALAGGADWILPLDADEFLWIGAEALRRRLASAPEIGAYRADIRNFVQRRKAPQDRPGSLRTMLVSAEPSGTEQDARKLVVDGLPFVRMLYPPKVFVRAVPGVIVHIGHHGADGLAGPLHPVPLAPLLHAPIRSRDDLLSRVAHGRRMSQWSDDPGVSWHLKRLIGMDDAALDREWALNSFRWPLRRGFRFDHRLAWLSLGLTRFRKRVT